MCACMSAGCSPNNLKVVRGAATFNNAFFRDTDGGTHNAMLMENICKFLGGKKKISAANSQPKDFFRREIKAGEQVYFWDSAFGGRAVTRHGVTLYLVTKQKTDEEPIWKSVGTPAFPCDCGRCISVFSG